MNRPKRQTKPVDRYDPSTHIKKDPWTLPEKETLLKAIQKHGKDDVAKLEKALKGTKNQAQIKHLLQKFAKPPGKDTRAASKEEAPVQTWMRLAEELIRNDVDYSDILGKVVSVCGSLEPHVPPKNQYCVDFASIYRYIAALLRGDAYTSLPHLNHASSAVLLDMIQSLANTLQGYDLAPQYQMMAVKYGLLKEKVVVSNPQHYDATCRALENDLPVEGENEAPESNTPEPPNEPPPLKGRSKSTRGRKRAQPLASSSTPSSDPGTSQESCLRNVDRATEQPAAKVPKRSTGQTTKKGEMSSTAVSESSKGPGQPVPTRGADPLRVQGTPQRIQLTLPQGIKLSPGAYQLRPQDLKAFLSSINNKVKQSRQPPIVPTVLPSGANSGAKEVPGGLPSGANSGAKEVLGGLPKGANSGGIQSQADGVPSELPSGANSGAIQSQAEVPSELPSGANSGGIQSQAEEVPSELPSGAKSGDNPGQAMAAGQSGLQSDAKSGDSPDQATVAEQSRVQSGAKSGDSPGQAMVAGQSEVQSSAKSGDSPGHVTADVQSGATSGDGPGQSGVQSSAKPVDVQNQAMEGVQHEVQNGNSLGDKHCQETQSETHVSEKSCEPQPELPSAANQRQTTDISPTNSANHKDTSNNQPQNADNQRQDRMSTLQSGANSKTVNSANLQSEANQGAHGEVDPNIQVLDKVVVSSGRVKKSTRSQDDLPKRTQLYSLNPFCIPIRYLRPNLRTQIPDGLDVEYVDDPQPVNDPQPGTSTDP